MASQIVDAMIEGGKASAAPPLGPALGPMGVNIGQVISEINKKTEAFKGMQVPVKVTINVADKSFTITVGTPPTSALIKKEAGIEKGAGNPLLEKVADLKIEQIIKVAKMKEGNLLGKDTFAKVKEVIGTCHSMGVLVEGKPAAETITDINNGAFKEKIALGKTELSAEELELLHEERTRLQAELEKRRAELTATAKQIIESLAGKPRGQIKAKLLEAKIPIMLIDELLPTESSAGAGAGGKPDAGSAPKKEEAKK